MSRLVSDPFKTAGQIREGNGARPNELRVPDELRRLKAQLHQQLVVGMDLSALASMSKEHLHLEVRRVADDLCQRSSSLLSRQERERLVNEVLDETFGLGPLESLM